MKRLIPLMMLAAVLSLAAVACGGAGTETEPTAQPPSPSTTPPETEPAPEGTRDGNGNGNGNGGGEVIEVGLLDSGNEFLFSPDEMSFSVGDTITFSLVSESQFHTFTVDDLDVNVSVNGGETGNVTVTFDQAGTFNLVCLPHESLGMVGTITVN